MATTEERLAALEQKMQMLTTPPDDYYMSRWTGEEIDTAVATAVNAISKIAKYYPGTEDPDIDTILDSSFIIPASASKNCPVAGIYIIIYQFFYAPSGTVSAARPRTQIALPYSAGVQGKGMAIRTFSRESVWSGWESFPGELPANIEFYVNGSTGNNSNPGTFSKPFKTIQAAVNSIPKNLGQYKCTIYIKDGIYEEDVLISGFFGGLDSNLTGYPYYSGLTFIKQGTEPTEVTVVRSFRVINCAVPSIVFNNISISNGLSTGDSNITKGTGIAIYNCPHVTLNGVAINNCTRGIMCGGYYSSGGSTVFLNGCSISGSSETAILCVGQNNVFAEGLSGSENTLGLYAQYGGIITTRALSMTATTDQNIYAGFINTF